MASDPARTVALMSIRPEFADLILAGQKQVEFRRTRVSERISHVVLYATEPVRAIVGFFEVKEIEEASPEELWERYEDVGGISEEKFRVYYKRSKMGVAIKVGRIVRLPVPLPLSSVEGLSRPPQSFQYIDNANLEGITKPPETEAE